MSRALALVIALCVSTAARADVTVDVHLSAQGQVLARQMGISDYELERRMTDRINGALGTDGASLQAFSDAAVLSSHGLGVDYVSAPESLIVGVAGNVAAANGDLSAIDHPIGGLAANVAVMAGLNLTAFHHPRWTVYGSGFYRSDTVDGITGAITNGGAHLQYALVEPRRGTVAGWTGLQVTTGLELTRWTLGTQMAMGTSFAVDGHNLGYNMSGTFELGSNSLTVPVELSTGVRIAIVSVYGGVGADFTQGEGTIDAMVSGPLTDDQGRQLGTAMIQGHDSHAASPFTPRAFGGVQLDAWKLKIFGHVNASAGSAASIGIGVRGVL
jgi:hypothetical protein